MYNYRVFFTFTSCQLLIDIADFLKLIMGVWSTSVCYTESKAYTMYIIAPTACGEVIAFSP